jgi:CRP-like cAMP-binding protein
VLETGDHFGEIALLRDVPRTATVRTLTPCIFLTLQRAQFLELIARIPGLARALEQVEVRRAALESADLTAGSASSRGPLRRAFDTTLSSRFR